MTYLISYTVFLVPYALQIANSHLDLKKPRRHSEVWCLLADFPYRPQDNRSTRQGIHVSRALSTSSPPPHERTHFPTTPLNSPHHRSPPLRSPPPTPPTKIKLKVTVLWPHGRAKAPDSALNPSLNFKLNVSWFPPVLIPYGIAFVGIIYSVWHSFCCV